MGSVDPHFHFYFTSQIGTDRRHGYTSFLLQKSMHRTVLWYVLDCVRGYNTETRIRILPCHIFISIISIVQYNSTSPP
jgi:hypothetical protein